MEKPCLLNLAAIRLDVATRTAVQHAWQSVGTGAACLMSGHNGRRATIALLAALVHQCAPLNRRQSRRRTWGP
eukprot:6472176-Amphidinium_carterae.1